MRQAATTMTRTVVALCGCRYVLSIVPVCFCVSATACFAALLNSNQAWSCMCIEVSLKAHVALSVAANQDRDISSLQTACAGRRSIPLG